MNSPFKIKENILIKKIKKIIKKFICKMLNLQDKPVFEFTIGMPADNDAFLIKNKIERMDANRYDLFNKTRCDFHTDRYRFASEYTEDKICIDCASGTGYGADILYKLGRAKKVYGLEINKEAYEYAKKYYASKNVDFVNGSILDIPFKDNTFDVFTSFETIEHVENEDLQLSEVRRVLKNGGLYILSTPNDWNNDKINPYHVRRYNYNSLKNTLSKSFEIIKIYNQNSGTENRAENNNMPRMIYKTTEENHHLAECFIAVCRCNK